MKNFHINCGLGFSRKSPKSENIDKSINPVTVTGGGDFLPPSNKLVKGDSEYNPEENWPLSPRPPSHHEELNKEEITEYNLPYVDSETSLPIYRTVSSSI